MCRHSSSESDHHAQVAFFHSGFDEPVQDEEYGGGRHISVFAEDASGGGDLCFGEADLVSD